MTQPFESTKRSLEGILLSRNIEEIVQRLTPRVPGEKEPLESIPGKNDYSKEAFRQRVDFLRSKGLSVEHITYGTDSLDPENLRGNIENFIGFAKLPLGLIGPLRVNGANTQGDFFVPLATNEGALVASYNRGSIAISRSGGAAAICLNQSVSRAPSFSFPSVREAGQFLAWMTTQYDRFHELVARRSSRAKLLDVKSNLTGKDLYLIFEYSTGDASGQNMVTLATEEICNHLVAEAPVKPDVWYIEGNLSGDKKATMLSFLHTRGKKVIAEVELPPHVLEKTLQTSAKAMHHYWEVSFLGGSQSGSIGSQGHFANALAALFIACGQDAACVSEAAVGITRMQVIGSSLYVSVTLPNLIVGTVGGGTALPTAQECLALLNCVGSGKAAGFSEICASTVLAGEISIIAALSAGHFAKAHAALGRKK